MMVAFKGRSFLRQYMPKKIVKWGFKLWSICDSVSGFCKKFSVYEGKRPGEAPTKGLGVKVVLDLADVAPLGSCIFADRYFSSVLLLKELEAMGKNYCGTIQTNRKSFPKKMLKMKKPKRGDSQGAVCKKTGVRVVQWQDNAKVCMVSSIGSPYKMDSCKRRVGGMTVEVPRPEIVSLYNKSMGGVDHNDQLRATYPIEDIFKSRRWYKKLYLGLFGMACTNAYILWNLFCKESGLGEKVTHEWFMLDLSEHLLDPEVAEVPVHAHGEARVHEPSFYKSADGEKETWCTQTTQPRCKVCALKQRAMGERTSSRTWYFCLGCRGEHDESKPVPLCDPDTTGMECWAIWHNKRRLNKIISDVRESRKRPRAR
jgi:hypothetical protein